MRNISMVLPDGRKFTLVGDMEALCQAEAAYGKPLVQMIGDARDGFASASRAILYGTLRAEHPDVTLSDASEIFAADPDAVASAISAAVRAFLPGASPAAPKSSVADRPAKRAPRRKAANAK